MTAPIVRHIGRRYTEPTPAEARRVRATIARQHAEALPRVEGQLWTRLPEVAK